MNRNYKLDKETTQRLLDLAVEDNLVKLHKKVGTKGELCSTGDRHHLSSLVIFVQQKSAQATLG
jgi:hypothetical protein